MPRMESCPDPARLEELLVEQMADDVQAALTGHLESCPDCRSAIERLAAGDSAWTLASRLAQRRDRGGPALERVLQAVSNNLGSMRPEAVRGIWASDDGLDFFGPPQRPDSVGRLDHYDILELAGCGGMSRVWRAFDNKLHRVVAIKVLAPVLAADSAARQRFVREARAAAAVAHEHVVPIHAVEEGGPIPYLVMQFVRGQSLQQRLDQSAPLPLAEILRIGAQTAEGLAAAHRQGLIHRDIKPANILLEEDTGCVKLSDFGLAYTIADMRLANDEVLAGTPQFMSPQQARGEPVDQRSDLFSLGSVLYAMCTGRPPFGGGDVLEVLRRVGAGNPEPIGDADTNVPDWLIAIVARLHAPDPARRFASADEVADLLERHRADMHRPRRVLSFARLAAVGALLLIVAVTVAAAIILNERDDTGFTAPDYAPEPGARSNVPEGLPSPAESAEVELSRKPSPFDRCQREKIPAELLALAGARDPAKAPAELVAILGDSRFLLPEHGPNSWPAVSRDGSTVAVPCGPVIALFDASDGRSLGALTGSKGRVFRCAFHPQGRYLASVAWDPEHTVTIWDLKTKKPARTLKGHTANTVWVAYDTDGNRLVTSGDDGTARFWNPDTGDELLQLKGHQGHLSCVALAASGPYLFTAGQDGALKRRSATTGEVLKSVWSHKGEVTCLAVSVDGKWVATGNEAEARIWHADTLEPLRTVAAPAAWLAFLPDGNTLLTAAHYNPKLANHQVRRWDVSTGKELTPLVLWSTSAFANYGLSADGTTLYAVGFNPSDPRLRVYDVQTGAERFPAKGHTGPVLAVAVHPDGQTLATGGKDRIVRIWNGPAGRQEHALPRHKGAVCSTAYSPDGTRLIAGGQDGIISVWSGKDGKKLGTLHGHARGATRVAFAPDGQTVLAGGDDGRVHWWDLSKYLPRSPLPFQQGSIRAVACNADMTLLASAGQNGLVQITAVSTGKSLHQFTASAAVADVAFSPDGRVLAFVTEGADPSLHLWTLETGHMKIGHGHTGPCTTVAFHPAGHLIATGAGDGTIRLWNANDEGDPQVIGPGPFGAAIHQLAFTPEGRYLVTANANSMIYALRLAGLGEVPRARAKATALK